MVVEQTVDLREAITRAGENLDQWVDGPHSLEIMSRAQDFLGMVWVRAKGHILTGISIPRTEWTSVPGHDDMEVWTESQGPYGVVHLRGPEGADWW